MMDMNGMGPMMAWMMGIGLLGWALVIGLLAAILVVLIRVLKQRGPGGPHRHDGPSGKAGP
jgi:hypothetical protein